MCIRDSANTVVQPGIQVGGTGNSGPGNFDCLGLLYETHGTVSYTHLDVYKRQEYGHQSDTVTADGRPAIS